MKPWLVGWVAVLVACEGPTVQDFTEDTRIDGAGAENDPDSFGTRMCAAPDGTVYVAWLDNRDHPGEEIYDLWMNRSLLDTVRTWLPTPIRVNHGDGNVWNPDLHCSAAGVFVVWEDDRDGDLHNRQVYFNRSEDQGATFLDEDLPLDADPDGVSMSFEPRITGSGDDLAVAWYDDRNGAYDIYVSRSSTGGASWTASLRADSGLPGASYSAHPRVAISENGRTLWVVWEDSRDDASDVWFTRSVDGVSFEPDQRLDGGDAAGSHDSFAPTLCTDGSDHVYAVWHDTRNGTGHDVLVNYSGNGGADWYASALRMDTDTAGLGDSLSPTCVADGATLRVAWSEKAGPTFDTDVYTREVVAGIPGGDPVRLDTGRPEGSSRSLDPQIAADLGNVVVAWADGRGALENGTAPDYDDLYYNYSRDGGPFSAEADFRVDSMLDGGSFKSDLQLDVLGGAWYAAWTDGRDGSSNIYFQSFPIGTEARPPVEEAAP